MARNNLQIPMFSPQTEWTPPDELHRLFYVATTRAKKELHIVSPKNYERSYPL